MRCPSLKHDVDIRIPQNKINFNLSISTQWLVGKVTTFQGEIRSFEVLLILMSELWLSVSAVFR